MGDPICSASASRRSYIAVTESGRRTLGYPNTWGTKSGISHPIANIQTLTVVSRSPAATAFM